MILFADVSEGTVGWHCPEVARRGRLPTSLQLLLVLRLPFLRGAFLVPLSRSFFSLS